MQKTEFTPIGLWGWAPPARLTTPMGGVAPVRWTLDVYRAAIEAGILYEGTRFELIEGQILQKENRPTPFYYYVLEQGVRRLDEAFGERARWSRGGCTISEDTEVAPDYLVTFDPWHSMTEHPKPGNVLLIGQVAESTLDFDTMHRARIYGQANILEYWVTDMSGRRLWVFRDPTPRGYTSVKHLRDTDTVTPVAAPEVVIPVRDLLPVGEASS